MSIVQSSLRGRQQESRLIRFAKPRSKAQAQEQSYWFLMRLMGIADHADGKTKERFNFIYQRMLSEHMAKYGS